MLLRLPLPPCQIHLADIPQEHRSDDNSSHSKPLLLQSPPHPPPQAPTVPQLGPSLKARDLPFLSGIQQHFPASGHLPQEFFSLDVTSPHTQLSETAHPSLKTQFTLFPARTQGYPSLVCKDRPLLIDWASGWLRSLVSPQVSHLVLVPAHWWQPECPIPVLLAPLHFPSDPVSLF